MGGLSGAPRRLAAGAALAAAALGVLALPASAAKDDLDLVSMTTGGAPADGSSSAPSITADGRSIAFTSKANNLPGPHATETPDVFLRDVDAGTTTLVSRGTTLADGPSFGALVSDDGSRVAFTSEATNLSDDDGDFPDVFVRDLQTNATILVSRSDGPSGEALDGISNQPSISADGRFVAFLSDAPAPGAAAAVNVFVRDLELGTTTLVSRAPGGDGADGNASAPSISEDGSRVAFLSGAENLSPRTSRPGSSSATSPPRRRRWPAAQAGRPGRRRPASPVALDLGRRQPRGLRLGLAQPVPRPGRRRPGRLRARSRQRNDDARQPRDGRGRSGWGRPLDRPRDLGRRPQRRLPVRGVQPLGRGYRSRR